MGCHFCTDEVWMILTAFTGVKYVWPWLRNLWATRHAAPNCRHAGGHKE